MSLPVAGTTPHPVSSSVAATVSTAPIACNHIAAPYIHVGLRQSSQHALIMCFSGKRVVQMIVIVFLLCIRGEYMSQLLFHKFGKLELK